MHEELKLKLLGHLQMNCGERAVTGFVSNKALALLCYLAVTRQTHTRDDLAVLLWSDMAEAEAKANLRVALCNLRRLLPDHIIADRKTVALNPDSPSLIDVTTFEEHLRQYDLAKERAISALQSAVELYQGDLLHGLQTRGALLFEEWLLLKREQLRQQALQSYYTLAAYHLQRAEYTTALSYTTSLLQLEPWHEEAHRQAMLLFALSGQRHLALAQYRTCREILSQEFGVEPEEETQALYRRIKAAPAGLSAPQASSPAMAAAQPEGPGLRPLVGRAAEFAWLMRQYEQARQGGSALSLIEGGSGSGKTALAEELLHLIGTSGGLLLQARCQDFSREVAYQPVIDLLRAVLQQTPGAFTALPAFWLRELHQLLPELSGATDQPVGPSVITTALGRQRLFEALAALFNEVARRHGEVVVFLDDLHNADSETLDLLNYLVSRRHEHRAWYLGAYRRELLNLHHPLLQLYHNLHRTQRVAQIKLVELTAEAVRELVARLEGLDPEAVSSLAELTYSRAGGNPLLCTTLLDDLVQRDLLCMVRGSWWLNSARLKRDVGHLPPRVLTIIEERTQHVPEKARNALQLAAMLGQHFELDQLAQSSGTSHQEAALLLRTLVAHQFVREQANIMHMGQAETDGFSFVSPLVWAAVLYSLPSGERGWLGEPAQRLGVTNSPRRSGRTSCQQSSLRTASAWRRSEQWSRGEL